MLSPPLPRLRPVRARAGGRAAHRVLLLGALATLAAVAFVFAPVRQPAVTYTWTPADGQAVALPLLPYQPVAIGVTTSCAAARPGGLLLSTTPPRPDPAAAPLAGLGLVATPAGVTVTTAGTTLGTVALPAGDCTLALTSDATATTVTLDGRPVLRQVGDVRPDVAGLFTALPDTGAPPEVGALSGAASPTGDVPRETTGRPSGGTATVPATITATVTADTRFATTPTPLKLALALTCLLALAGLGVVVARADRRGPTRRVRLLPAGWWRPRPVDAAVAALLLLWWAVGAGTVDDGYLAGIVRSRAENGYVGNAYRWLNAPEAPFSWFVEPYRWWSLVSPGGYPVTPWMRLPSTLLGLLCWALVSRLLLPRLGAAGRRRGTAWVAALAFTTWWIPLNLGLRPEPWVAVGGVLVFVAVERALATGRVLPLAGALTAAGVTAAVTPAGLMAGAPVLAAAVPLLRLLRARTDLQLDADARSGTGRARRGAGALRALPLVAVLVAAPAAALLLMAADQGAAALAEAVRVRGAIGGGRPWAEESARYALLVTPGAPQGADGPHLQERGQEARGIAAHEENPDAHGAVALGLEQVGVELRRREADEAEEHHGAGDGEGGFQGGAAVGPGIPRVDLRQEPIHDRQPGDRGRGGAFRAQTLRCRA